METRIGKVYLTREALVKIAGYATTECYGVVAMAKKTPNDLLRYLLKRDNIAQGVELKMTGQGVYLTVNVILELGIRLSEVVRNIREQVAFRIKSMAHLENLSIDIIVCNVRIHEE